MYAATPKSFDKYGNVYKISKILHGPKQSTPLVVIELPENLMHLLIANRVIFQLVLKGTRNSYKEYLCRTKHTTSLLVNLLLPA